MLFQNFTISYSNFHNLIFITNVIEYESRFMQKKKKKIH